ncbi:MAG: 16S rRNA (cytosine(1402)-N(4))-methyltransferase RsmH [Zetaproteobacteria bacterium]|nr:16S rRNA (cytosine(1402)-N(4))-methyltransferase RsmH [Zetaproteobacteria bacterium]
MDDRHIPVLHSTALDVLHPEKGESVLDVTLGLGGHASAFLKAVGDGGHLYALDADERNLIDAKKVLGEAANISLFHTNFGQLDSLDIPKVDIVFADLGLSSPHIDEGDRGFTFREDAPLDMRFDRSSGISASDFLATASEDDIAYVLRQYGEVKQSRKMAVDITNTKPKTTHDLKQSVERVCGFRAKSVLPQVFQAIRIVVNDEIAALKHLLDVGPLLLKEGGRMGVISYHSLEDRPVKQMFKTLTTPEKDDLTGAISKEAPYELVTKKPIRPSEEEISNNPRARSALFRVIRRVSKP